MVHYSAANMFAQTLATFMVISLSYLIVNIGHLSFFPKLIITLDTISPILQNPKSKY